MLRSKQFASPPLVLLVCLCSAPSTWATDLTGAWASDLSACGKVFEKRGDTISLAPTAELFGGGVLIEPEKATGSFQKCKLKSIHRDGATIHVTAACSTGVMVSEMKFDVKIVGENQITISPRGPVETEVPLVRCLM
jgi:hypothetical protein